MDKEEEKINQDIKDCIFRELVDRYEYWGESSLIEMIDFCNRNQLRIQKSILTKLLKPNRIKS